jgi:hypothetical protein
MLLVINNCDSLRAERARGWAAEEVRNEESCMTERECAGTYLQCSTSYLILRKPTDCEEQVTERTFDEKGNAEPEIFPK